MKKIITFLLLIQGIHWSASGQQWVKKNLADSISVSFPSADLIKGFNHGQTSFSYVKLNGLYIGSIQDMNALSAETFGSKAEVNQFYSAAAAAMVKRFNGKLLQTSDFYIRGLKGMEIKFTFKHKSGFVEERFSRFLIVRDKTIILQCATPRDSTVSGPAKRKQFFDSLQLKGNDDDLWQYESDEDRAITRGSYLFTKWFLILLFIGFLTSIIGGIIALIVYMVRRGKKKKV